MLRRIEDPWAFVQPVMAAGPLLLDVRGRPAPAGDAGIGELVRSEAERAMTWTARPRVTLSPAESARSPLRLVVLFEPGPAADPCAAGAEGGDADPAGGIALLAALCEQGDWLARVDGRLRRSRGPDDPRLRALVRQATRDLLAPPPAPRG